MTDHDHKHFVPGCYRCDLGRDEERDHLLDELDALRARVGWLDHLDTAEGRAMHATEAVRVKNEQVRAQRDSLAATLIEVQRELQAARADLREAMELLRAHGQAPGWVTLLEAADWDSRYGELLEKHKETP